MFRTMHVAVTRQGLTKPKNDSPKITRGFFPTVNVERLDPVRHRYFAIRSRQLELEPNVIDLGTAVKHAVDVGHVRRGVRLIVF